MEYMKKSYLLSIALLVAFIPLASASDSKRTAEYILATPGDFEGKTVTLDVAFVKPVQWKSPIPELAFFRAMTIDRRDKKAGGHILIAIPASEAGKFSKKYGMDFDGRGESDTLSGSLLTAPGKGADKGRRGQIWFIDTTGTAVELIKAKKLELNDDGPRGGRGEEGFGEKRRQGRGDNASS